MSIRISGPIGRASFEHRRSLRSAGYLATCLGAWAMACSSASVTNAPDGNAGQGGSSAVTTGGTQSGPGTGGATQVVATGGMPGTGGSLPGTGGKQTSPTGGSPALTGGAAATGGAPPTGGVAPTGGKSSTAATGGTSTGTGGTTAMPTGGTKATTSGGTSAMPTGGTTAAGGSTSTGGSSTGTAGSTSTSGATPSKGCGNANGQKTLTTGGSSVSGGLATSVRLKITSGGSSREYIIDIPANYNPNTPYRLVFSWHQAYGSDTGNATGLYPAFNGPNFDAQHYAYFGLQRESAAANQPAIFVAPGGIGNLPWDYNRDVQLFDDLLALVTTNLCIDESRVFTTGFSFGAMMSYALSITRQKKLRAAVTMAAANYNLPGEPTDSNAAPIAYFGITGMSDGTCPWGNDTQGGKACVTTHAKDNGCTIPGSFTTATVGSKKYVCYDYDGCKAGYPVKVCTFDGAHTPSAVDDGSNGGDDGLKAFVPPLAWKFMAQF